jgi:signal peptidase II
MNVLQTKPLYGSPPWALGLALLVTVLDQITKALVRRTIGFHDEIVLIPGFLSLRHGENRGLAFGVLQDAPLPFQSILLSVLALTLVALLLVLWARVATSNAAHAALGLILGGALGNVIDRVRTGGVTDFVHAHWRGHVWPDFNVADSAICVAIALLLLDSLRSRAPGSPEGMGRA